MKSGATFLDLEKSGGMPPPPIFSYLETTSGAI